MVRDFSHAAEEKLLSIVDQVEDEKLCDVTDWFGDRWYDFRDLINTLEIDSYLDRISDYHKIVIDKNNTTKEDIRRIFTNVREVDDRYMTRFSACQNRLQSFKGLVDALTGIVGSGRADSGSITAIFNGAYNTFSQDEEILAAISGDGLESAQLDGMAESELKTVLDNLGKTMVVLIPDIKLGTKVEIPIGPDLTFYYSADGKIDGGNDSYDVNLILEDQKLQFKNAQVSSQTDGLLKVSGKAGTDETAELSVEAPNSSVTFNVDGSMETSGSMVVGNKTYTIKIEVSANELVAEESVKTDFEKGSITSTIGLKKATNNWKPLPVPEPVNAPVTLSLPQVDVDWGRVAVYGTAIVIIAGVALAPATGGASLVLCAA